MLPSSLRAPHSCELYHSADQAVLLGRRSLGGQLTLPCAQVPLSASAQAAATLLFASLFPGNVAQPDFTKYSCCS
jgi:hypothetical protein